MDCSLYIIHLFADIKDLFSVHSELIPVSLNWKDIGLALGLGYDKLQIIERNNQDVTDCLRETLAEWLKNTTRPTWELLVAAVANPTGGNDNALAEHIAEKLNGKCYNIIPNQSAYYTHSSALFSATHLV